MGRMFADLYNKTQAPPRAGSKSVEPGSKAKVGKRTPLLSEEKARLRAKKKAVHKPVSRPTDKPTGKQIGQSIDQPVDRPRDLSTMLSTIRSTDRKVNRPVAFYLSERQNEILDIANHNARETSEKSADSRVGCSEWLARSLVVIDGITRSGRKGV